MLGRILYSENEPLLQELNQQNLKSAMETGRFVDINVDMIYQIAKSKSYEGD